MTKIAWYDHGYIHQSAGIPDLPRPDEVPMTFTPGVKHAKANVIGNEMWRIPVLHKLLEDGHELVWLSRRDIMPSEDHDWDLQNVIGMRPDLEPFIHERDPMLDVPVWSIRSEVNLAYADELQAWQTKAEKEGKDPTPMMFREWINTSKFGQPPEVDVAVIAAMRANVATGFENNYLTLKYLERGTPVVIYDQDRQMTGLVAGFRRAEVQWPHPLVTVIGPYDEELSYGKPHIIDYPYVTKFEQEPRPQEERNGVVYVGNDYDRREAMERLFLPLAPDVPVHVWGKYEGNTKQPGDSRTSEDFKAQYPDVTWEGRVESNRVPSVVAAGTCTFNVVKKNYQKIGLLTLRTFDSVLYGTLQVGDRRIHRIKQYVPLEYLVETGSEAGRLVKKIVGYTDDEYREELERQRELTKVNDLDAYMQRLYDLLYVALRTTETKAAAT